MPVVLWIFAMVNKNGFRTFEELRKISGKRIDPDVLARIEQDRLERDVIVNLWAHSAAGENGLVVEAFSRLRPNDFECPIHHELWKAALWLYMRKSTITPVLCWLFVEKQTGVNHQKYIDEMIRYSIADLEASNGDLLGAQFMRRMNPRPQTQGGVQLAVLI